MATSYTSGQVVRLSRTLLTGQLWVPEAGRQATRAGPVPDTLSAFQRKGATPEIPHCVGRWGGPRPARHASSVSPAECGQGRTGRLRSPSSERVEYRRTEEVLRRHARWDGHQVRPEQRGRGEVPQRPRLLPTTNSNRRHKRDDCQSHRILSPESSSGRREDQGERFQDDYEHRG